MEFKTLKEKLLVQMKGEDLLALISEKLQVTQQTELRDSNKKYVYGISGIQSLLNCSESSAKRLKKSGIIDDAIIQNGRKIIVDVELALELLKKNQNIGRKR